MPQFESPYYPPRATRLGGKLRECMAAARRLGPKSFQPKPVAEIGFMEAVIAVTVPCLGMWFAGQGSKGRLMLGAYVVALVVFFIAYGSIMADIAAGTLVVLHVVGTGTFIRWADSGASPGARIIANLCIAVALLIAIYLPLRNLMLNQVAMVFHTPNGTVVVNRLHDTRSISRGSTVAYRIRGNYDNGVYVHEGYGIEKVLAMPGDRVKFAPEGMYINATEYPRTGQMPTSGELVVPANCWFIWPRRGFTRFNESNPNAINISRLIMEVAVVRQDDFLGVPFKHWLWRSQPES